MTGSKFVAAFAATVVVLFAGGSPPAAADTPRSIEKTLSYQLLQFESTVRPVSSAKFALLRSAVQRGADAARARHWTVRTRRDAIDTLDAIQVVLAEHNFIQPALDRGWTETIGDALEPLQLSPEERRRLLAPGEVNGFRARYIDPAKPLYSIDDDMGAQLIVSVGERLGWPIRLMWGYDRFFVRWHYSPTQSINWDWTAGGPTSDEDYPIGEGGLYQDWSERKRYLVPLTARFARAQYLLQLSRRLNSVATKRATLEWGMKWDPTHEVAQNELAWLYATDPVLGRPQGRRAVSLALSAWAASPGDALVADTVACAFAAAGERGVAAQIERFAINQLRKARRNREIPDYEGRLGQIQAGRLCTAAPTGIDDEPD
jgi:hypothetical protein